MKSQVVHSSSGVVLLKDKTVVNTKHASSPLAIIQFQTDTANLHLEVSHV